MSWRSENNPLFVSRLRSIKRIPSRCTCRASSSCRLGPPFVNCQETNHFVRLWASALGSVLLAVYVFSLFNVPPPQTGRTEIKRRMMTTAEKKREENKRMDTREQNSERQTLVYPRRAKETDTIGQETPKSGAPATSRRYR